MKSKAFMQTLLSKSISRNQYNFRRKSTNRSFIIKNSDDYSIKYSYEVKKSTFVAHAKYANTIDE